MFCLRTQFHLLSPQGYRVTCGVYLGKWQIWGHTVLWKNYYYWYFVWMHFAFSFCFQCLSHLYLADLKPWIITCTLQHNDPMISVIVQLTKRNFLCWKPFFCTLCKTLMHRYLCSLQHITQYSRLVQFFRSSRPICLQGIPMRAISTLLTLSFSTLTYLQEQPQLVASHWDDDVSLQATFSRRDLLKSSLKWKLNSLMERFLTSFHNWHFWITISY